MVVAYLRDVTFIILELLPSNSFHGNILPFHFIQRWCGEVWDFHYTGPNPWPSGCWGGELTDWCGGCGQEYAKPENADGASCCKWQIQPHTTVAVSPRYAPHLHAKVACGSLQYWACYCHLLIQLQFLQLLMFSTDKQFSSKTQLYDKSTAGRFDPKVFVNCTQLYAVDKDLWVGTSCSSFFIQMCLAQESHEIIYATVSLYSNTDVLLLHPLRSFNAHVLTMNNDTAWTYTRMVLLSSQN